MSLSSRITLLGIPIDALTMREVLERLRRFLSSGHQHPTSTEATVGRHVMTPNNEMLVESMSNPRFRQILQKSDLNLPDSRGLLLAARWTGQHLPERVTGVDVVQEFCRVLGASHSVFLLGAGPGVAEKAARVLRSRNPQLVIAGTYEGAPRTEDAEEIIGTINAVKPSLLLVAFGAPAQDLWIDQNLKQMPSVQVAMGVGGTFDFIAGVRKRAPKLIRKVGLEWLWRFVQEPSRWKRMWNAVVVFPWLIIKHKRSSAAA